MKQLIKVRNNFLVIAALCIVVFCLGACSSWEVGVQSIDISIGDPDAGGDDGVEPFSEDIKEEYFNDVEYTITLTNGKKTEKIGPAGGGNIEIPQGIWDIKVEAVGPRIRGSWEGEGVEVVAGVISKTIRIAPEATRVNAWEQIKTDLTNLGDLGVDCIEITESFTAGDTINLTNGADIKLKAADNKEVTITRGQTDTVFKIGLDSDEIGIETTTLILGNNSESNDSGMIIIDGNSDIGGYGNNDHALIDVLRGGKLKMYDGVTLQNNTTQNGGGVYVDYRGTFEMHGGTITNNKAENGGGVCVYENNGGGTFNMTGGTISGNEATKEGGGIYIGNNSTFIKTGGIIYGSNGGDKSNTGGTNGGFAIYVGNDYKRNDTLGENDRWPQQQP